MEKYAPIYLNYAATSAQKPAAVIEAVIRYLNTNNEATTNRSYLDFERQSTLYEAREAVAQFFGATDSSLVFFNQNITLSLNMILNGLLQPGDHVITTSVEHNAVMRPLYLQQRAGVEVTVLPCTPEGLVNPKQVAQAIKKNTRVLVMSHASNVLGTIQPVGECFRIAHAAGVITVLDTAQTAGVLPVNFQKLAVDCLAFTGHKSLQAQAGIGGFILRPQVAKIMQPWLVGGTGTHSELATMPELYPDKFEAGTPNYLGIVSLLAGINWLNQVGVSTVWQKESELCESFLNGLASLPVRVLGINDAKHMAPVISVVPEEDTISPDELAQQLYEDYQIVTRCGLHCAPNAHQTAGTIQTGAVRFSFGYQTSHAEVNYALHALAEILGDES